MGQAPRRESIAARRLAQLPSRRVAVFHSRVPQAEASGSDLRIRLLLEELAAAGHRVTLVTPSPPAHSAHRRALSRRGVEIEKVSLAGLASVERDRSCQHELATLLNRKSFDLFILVQQHQGGFSLAESLLAQLRWRSPHSRLAVLADELLHAREGSLALATGELIAHERGEGAKRREADVYRKADLVLVRCEEDQARVSALAPDTIVSGLGFGFRPLRANGPGWEKRKSLLFLGSGESRANRDAVRQLFDETWPRIHELCPELHLHVVGSLPEGGWHPRPPEGVQIQGLVTDCSSYLDRSLAMLSPLPHGLGLRAKHVRAACAGLPIITTANGAEGLRHRAKNGVLVRESTEDIAQAVKDLSSAPEQWQDLHESALVQARRTLGRAKLCEDLHGLLAILTDIAPKSMPSRQDSPGLEVLSWLSAEQRDSWFAVHHDARLARARQLMAAGKDEGAIQELRNILLDLRALPMVELSGPLALLGRLHLRQGRHQHAERCMEAAEHAEPGAEDAISLRAELLTPA